MAKKPGNFEVNVAAITALRAARRAAQDAEIELRRAKRDQDAEAAWERGTQLTMQIDVLIGRLMQKWTIDIQALSDELIAHRTNLDEALSKIRENQQTAKQVVSILKSLDKVIEIGFKLMG